MSNLSSFKITKRWPSKNDKAIQLYSLPTPNGVKVSIALEELGLDYEAHRINFSDNDQKTDEFLSLNPNGKIPAIIDPNGPDGKPLGLFESGAILLYLAEKEDKLLPKNKVDRLKTLQWLFFQMGGIGPMFGQFGHFYKYAADQVKDPYPQNRYLNETKRLLKVLDQQLENKKWLVAETYTIADISIFPWVRTLDAFYEAADILELKSYKNVMAWLERALSRPAVQKGISIPE